jgi:hypothetical protein
MELSVFFTAWKMAVRCGSTGFSNLLLTEGHIIAYYQRSQMMAGAAVSALSLCQNIDLVFVFTTTPAYSEIVLSASFSPKSLLYGHL